MIIPPPLVGNVRKDHPPAIAERWLGELPALVDRLLRTWRLYRDPAFGGPWHGYQSLVVPVTGSDGVRLALRIAAPSSDPVVAHPVERAALLTWGGRGSVRLLADDPANRAMLLERLDASRTIGSIPIADAITVWASLMRRLSVAGPAGIPTVAETARGWLDRLPRLARSLLGRLTAWRPSDEQLLHCALATADELTRLRPDTLVHGDLHFYNVLAELDGSGWRAIDPQPVIGPGEFAVAPMLWNRLYDLPGGAPAAQADALRARSAALAGAAGLDADLARRVSIGREMENILFALGDGAIGDAERSLWVCRALAGADVAGIDARDLARLV